MNDRTQGVIHDQGYQRYRGDRRPQGRRFLVIARNVLTSAWKQKWGVKLPIWLTVMAVVVGAGILVVRAQFGAAARRLQPEMVMYFASQFFTVFGFILSSTVAVPAVADDLKSGAFYFYFARPLRTGDYVRGKLLGILGLVGLCTMTGPLLLGVVQLALAPDFGAAVDQLPLLGKSVALGVAATFALGLPAAALGALVGRRGPAQAAFVVYYLVLSNIFVGVSKVLRVPELSILSISQDIETIGRALYDRGGDPFGPHPAVAALGIVGFAVAGYALMSWRVRSAESAGLGGG